MSDCNACLIGMEADGCVDIFDRTIVKKSRKPHRCHECRSEIPIGAAYETTFTVFEGEALRSPTCMICVEIRDTFYCAADSMPCIGRLWEDIDDENFWERFNIGCLSKLRTPEAKALMVKKWQEWKGL